EIFVERRDVEHARGMADRIVLHLRDQRIRRGREVSGPPAPLPTVACRRRPRMKWRSSSHDPPPGGRGPRINDITPLPLLRTGRPSAPSNRDPVLHLRGFSVIAQESSFTPLPDGRYLFYHGSEEDTFQAVAKFSRRDAEAMPRFGRLMARMAKFIAPTLTMTPPDVGSLNPSELRKLLALNKQVKTLTEDELYTFARLMTMSAADYLDEWFETDVVKASLCSSG